MKKSGSFGSAFAVILLAFLMLGCEGPSYFSQKVRWSDLPGTYYANFGNAKADYIELRPDSTYTHVYIERDGSKYADTGSWRFIDNRDGYYAIQLGSFVRRHPQKDGCFYEGPLPAFNRTPVDAHFSYYKLAEEYVIDYCFKQHDHYVKRGR